MRHYFKLFTASCNHFNKYVSPVTLFTNDKIKTQRDLLCGPRKKVAEPRRGPGPQTG